MDRLFYFLGDIHHTKLGGADSFSDQLNCKYTVYVLCVFALLATTNIYVKDPINCFCPANFESSHVNYANNFCWATNTHYLPFEKDLPKEFEERNYISYYQWVPLFLALQSILFYMPRLLWRALSRKSGVVLYSITDAAIECQRKTDKDDAEKCLQYMSNSLIRYLKDLRIKRDQPGFLRFLRRAYCSYYLTVVYLIIKLLYVGNVVGQLFFVNAFLGTDFHLYGVDVVKGMISGKDWRTSHRFPRVTICDFHIRALGNIHRHTVQCALTMNLYNEMLFVFLWFWFVFVSVVTVIGFVYWTSIVIGIRQQVNYVRPRLAAAGKFGSVGSNAFVHDDGRSRQHFVASDDIEMIGRKPLPSLSVQPPDVPDGVSGTSGGWPRMGEMSTSNERRGGMVDMSRFVDSYLLCDGCLIVRLIAENSSDMVTAELLCRLYDHYINSSSLRATSGSHSSPSKANRGKQLNAPLAIDLSSDGFNGNSADTTLDKNDNIHASTHSLTSPHRRLTPSSPYSDVDRPMVPTKPKSKFLK